MNHAAPSPVHDSLITHQRHLETEYAFCIGDIPTTIRVRVYRQLDGNRFSCEQSHYIQTPLQAEPIYESADDHASIDACLTTITGDMAEQYRKAEEAGHKPSEDWLLPSRDYE